MLSYYIFKRHLFGLDELLYEVVVSSNGRTIIFPYKHELYPEIKVYNSQKRALLQFSNQLKWKITLRTDKKDYFFKIKRNIETSISQSGVIAEGFISHIGFVAVFFLSKYTSYTIHESFPVAEAVHTSDGNTEIIRG